MVTNMTTPFYAQSVDDLLTLDQTLTMSGYDFMLGIKEGRYPAPPIGKALGYQLSEVGDGRIVFRGVPTFDTLNPLGTVHGGWYGTLLDSAMACAVMTKVPKGKIYTTLEYKINIIRSIPVGAAIEAIGETDHAGRSTGVATGRIVGVSDGRLYATGSTTCLIMAPK